MAQLGEQMESVRLAAFGKARKTHEHDLGCDADAARLVTPGWRNHRDLPRAEFAGSTVGG